MSDMVLRAPVSGRIEYRVVEPGSVIPSGGRVATLLNTADVHMTVFLPTSVAGRLKLGDEARIVLDANRAFVIPATVSFVAAEAQFTPKYVETAAERTNSFTASSSRFQRIWRGSMRPMSRLG